MRIASARDPKPTALSPPFSGTAPNPKTPWNHEVALPALIVTPASHMGYRRVAGFRIGHLCVGRTRRLFTIPQFARTHLEWRRTRPCCDTYRPRPSGDPRKPGRNLLIWMKTRCCTASTRRHASAETNCNEKESASGLGVTIRKGGRAATPRRHCVTTEQWFLSLVLLGHEQGLGDAPARMPWCKGKWWCRRKRN
jgi:hypothetical protein